jgi:hypothetical protein
MKPVPLLLLITMVAALVACGPPRRNTQQVRPSTIKVVEGTESVQVILTEKAAERLGVETVLIDGHVVPYSAVIYDTEGNAWIYTNPEPLTFVRARIVIDRIEGDQAFLSEPLETDLPVVTVGVAEIYGAETGVSK